MLKTNLAICWLLSIGPEGTRSFAPRPVLTVHPKDEPPQFCNRSDGGIAMSLRRSGCPINLTLETFGDRWSLIVLRDIMFGNARTFRALLTGSLEGIASNILADRLARLVDHGLLTRGEDAAHRQRVIYSLTEAAIELVPMM